MVILGVFGAGSSPLARGLPIASTGGASVHRIIPARAGFTNCRSIALAHVEDHPRSRGVYLIAAQWAGDAAGSSPLARGLLPVVFPVAVLVRIIPARAGFTGRVELARHI